MKSITTKIAYALLCGMMFAGTVQAQTNDAETQLKLLQAKANDVNAKLKVQAAKLNKTYNEVNPDIEEQMNDKEDSIYLSLLSEKRTYELQMEEIKKAERTKKAQASAAQASAKTANATPTVATKAKKLKVAKAKK